MVLGLSPHLLNRQKGRRAPSSPRASSACVEACLPAACGHGAPFLPWVSLSDKRPLFPALFSRKLRLRHSCPFYPASPPRPSPPRPSPVGAWSPAGRGVAGVPGGAISGLLCPPTSLVALRQFYGGRIEAVFLLAGLFLHFSSPALIFPGLPAPSLRTLPFPPPLICQPSQERGPLASKVIELLGGRQATVFCLSALGLLPLERG